MKLLELFEQSGKTAAVAFGRMNPPTIGHQKVVDAILKQEADAHFLFVSQTHKPTGKNKTRYENPLPFDVKLGFIQQAFPNIDIGDTSVSTAIGILQSLEKQGFDNVIFVCGSDRVPSFTELFNKQNGIDYNLQSIKIVSSGARDPDAEGAEGMSASKMRAAAIADDFESFKSGLPAGLQGEAEEVFAAVKQGLEPWIGQEAVPEGWKSKVAGAALAGAAALGGGAHAQSSGEDYLPDIVAHVKFKVNGKEISKDINLGTQYKSPREAAEALEKFLRSKGIKYFEYDLERVKPKDVEEGGFMNFLKNEPPKKKWDPAKDSRVVSNKKDDNAWIKLLLDKHRRGIELTVREWDSIKQWKLKNDISKEDIKEAPIEMDPSEPMNPMIVGHDKANPAKLKYRMLRAAGQLKDLAARAENASPSEWQIMARQFEELKMNMEQIRHALEELGKIKSKGGIRSRGITV